MTSGFAWEAEVKILCQVLSGLSAQEANPLKHIIDEQISGLISGPLPDCTVDRVCILKGCLNLQLALEQQGWHHKDMDAQIKALLIQISNIHLQGINEGGRKVSLRENCAIAQVLFHIKDHCYGRPAKLSRFQARNREIVNEFNKDLAKPFEGTIEERLAMLSDVTKARSCINIRGLTGEQLEFHIEEHTRAFQFSQVDIDELCATTTAPSINKEEQFPTQPPISLTATFARKEQASFPQPQTVIKQEPLSSTQIPFADLSAERQDQTAKAQARKEAIAEDLRLADLRRYAEDRIEQMRKEKLEKQKVRSSINADMIAREEKTEQFRLKTERVDMNLGTLKGSHAEETIKDEEDDGDKHEEWIGL